MDKVKVHKFPAKLQGLILLFSFLLPHSIANTDMLKRLNKQYKQILIDSHIGILFQLSQRAVTTDLLKQRIDTPLSLAQIIEIDKNWSNDKNRQTQITQNQLAKYLSVLINSQHYSFAELMLVDANGALVAAYPLTSDFWQGDEDKFTKAIETNNFSVTPAQWDESTQRYSFFMTVPITQNTQTIGALIAGLKVTPEYMQSLEKASEQQRL
ncbi:PDC sensor domain-containing protein [Catenovulum agarivorans]|uniref:PDC sensor domain-containing protein n=1 Tax=Catenovulum agarivorans TaxID=1172192 RepID=UPI0003683B21|nr:PDC sensor domain-containing protein [Catenovulum agarivorans]